MGKNSDNKILYGSKSDLGIIMKKSTIDVVNSTMRDPCEYCGQKHLEYACDRQIEYLKATWKKY